jgi:membrane protein insertase Oxa1/YidC/SpoIIIJ
MIDQSKYKQLLLNLKRGAPLVFGSYISRKIQKLQGEIEQLRQEYKFAKDEKEKQQIKEKGLELKKELEVCLEVKNN